MTELNNKVLGYLTLFSVGEIRISKDDLKKLFVEVDLSYKYLPEDPTELSAFKRASDETDELFQEKIDDTKTAVYMVRLVEDNDHEVLKKLIKEIRDISNDILSYQEVGHVWLVKPTQLNPSPVIHWRPNPGSEHIVNHIKQLYTDYCNNLTGRSIRTMFRRILDSLTPSMVRPGVYLIPTKHKDIITKLKTLATKLKPYTITNYTTSFYSVPIVDLDEMQDFIRYHADDHNTKEIDSLITDLTQTLTTEQTVTPKTAAKFAEKAKSARDQIQTYESKLNVKLDIARAKADILDLQITTMLNKVNQTIIPIPVPA